MSPPLSLGTAVPTPPSPVVRASGAFGSLIDADPERETVQLMDLQNRQSGLAALSKAIPAPQTLLSLFGDA